MNRIFFRVKQTSSAIALLLLSSVMLSIKAAAQG
jgi:hypothetical protein